MGALLVPEVGGQLCSRNLLYMHAITHLDATTPCITTLTYCGEKLKT